MFDILYIYICLKSFQSWLISVASFVVVLTCLGIVWHAPLTLPNAIEIEGFESSRRSIQSL